MDSESLSCLPFQRSLKTHDNFEGQKNATRESPSS